MRLLLLTAVVALCAQAVAQEISDDFSRLDEKRWARWAIHDGSLEMVRCENGKLVIEGQAGKSWVHSGIVTKFPEIGLPETGALVLELGGVKLTGAAPVLIFGFQKKCSVWPEKKGLHEGDPGWHPPRLTFSLHVDGRMGMGTGPASGGGIAKQGYVRGGCRLVIEPGPKRTKVILQTLEGKVLFRGEVDAKGSHTRPGDKNYFLVYALSNPRGKAFRVEVDYIRVGRGTATGAFVGAEPAGATRPKFDSPEGTWLMIREGRADGGLLAINKSTAKEVKRGDEPPGAGENRRRVCPLSWRSGRRIFTGTASVSGAVASFKMSSGDESFSGRLIFSSDYNSAVGFWSDDRGEGVLRAVRYEGAPPAVTDDGGQPATFVGTWAYTAHHLVGVTKGLVNKVIATVKPLSPGKVRIEWVRPGAEKPYGVGTATISGRVLHYEWISKENPGEKGHGWWVIGNRGRFISGVFEGDKGGGKTYGGISHGERKK